MGGVVSSGRNNDELVDNLMESGYIRTKRVEQVFRAVDRVNYVLCTHRENAYKDLAWKHGNIHLSAPCIYSEVMEGLSLEPGLSFLNLGSGTGYLSTMAGLILNQHGTNHGIELHEDCLKYAYDRLDEFKLNSLALDEFDFCEPVFVQGNCLSVVPARQYDRVYCGAACPETHEAYIKQYVRVGGILVMPFKDHLLRIQRVDDNTWTHHTMLPVSFAPLIVPKTVENNLYHLPECDPLSLQELCRGKIRHRLRQNVWCEHADLETKKPILPGRQILSPQQNALRRLVIPIFEESDEDEDFAGRARLLLNVDAHEEALSTALQLVGRVIQPNQNEDRQNWQETTNNGNNDNNRFIVASVDLHRDADDEDRDNNGKEEPVDPDTDDTANDDDDVADSSTNGNREENDRELEQRRNATEAYSNASDSDTDPEQETAFAQRKKIAKREKTDSGIVEDANFTNDEASSSSNTNQSDSEMADTTDNTDAMDVDLYDVTPNKSLKNAYNSYSTSANSTSNQEVAIAHYIDENAFSSYMKDKIHQLPLPFALKLYINYNRKL